MGSVIISTTGEPSLTEETTEGSTECWVGVRGEESTTEEGEMSDCDGDDPLWGTFGSWMTEVASESSVYSDGALALILTLTGVDVLEGGWWALYGLAVCVLGTGGGDFARMVLGCEFVVEVRSVSSYLSLSRMLEREATRGPAWDVVMRVPLSTLRLPSSISRATVSESFRWMLFALAVFLRSAAVVAVSGGLGGARGGVGAVREGRGGCGGGGDGAAAADDDGDDGEDDHGTSRGWLSVSLSGGASP
jgi:hypothetical protein